MKREELNKAICAIVVDVVERLDIEEIIHEVMIEHGIHPANDEEVTESQIDYAFNEIYEEIIGRFQHDRGLF